MIVICATDRSFLELTGVMLRSLAVHGDIPDTEIQVLGYRLTAVDANQLKACNHRVSVTDLTDELDSTKTLGSRGLFSKATYSRLWAPRLFAHQTDRLFYVDGDAIVTGSLQPLRDLPMNGKIAAAAPEGASGFARAFNITHKRPENTPYFNAGIMLIDVPAWNEAGISDAAIAYADRSAERDQNTLNLMLDGRWMPLEQRWNCRSQKAHDLADARIIHFVGPRKPNMEDCRHPARDLFLQHRAETPWRDASLISEKARKRKKLGQKLRALGKRIRIQLVTSFSRT